LLVVAVERQQIAVEPLEAEVLVAVAMDLVLVQALLVVQILEEEVVVVGKELPLTLIMQVARVAQVS